MAISKMSGERRNYIIFAFIVVFVVAGFALSTAVLSGSFPAPFPRSGPISTFPASWICSTVGVKNATSVNERKATTINELSGIVYPYLWNTTTRVSLAQVYAKIIDSPAFTNVSSGHGWITAAWWSDDAIHHDILGWFVLTNGTSPVRYVTASYDMLNGKVTIDYQTNELGCY